MLGAVGAILHPYEAFFFFFFFFEEHPYEAYKDWKEPTQSQK